MNREHFQAKYPIREGELVRINDDCLAVPMRRFVVIDTETNGLPMDNNKPAYVVDNWPRIVQIAIVIWWADEVREGSHLIRPDGWEIPPDATKIHGITQERAVRDGKGISTVLEGLVPQLQEPGTVLVAHNVDFDARVLGAEFIRKGLHGPAKDVGGVFTVNENTPQSVVCGMPSICTMKQTTEFCKLPGNWKNSYKWPKLQELHQALFGEGFDDAHDALADARACLKCFLELWKKGIIDA